MFTVTPTTLLGCLSCYGFLEEEVLFLVKLASLCFQKTYLATFLDITMQPRNSPGADV